MSAVQPLAFDPAAPVSMYRCVALLPEGPRLLPIRRLHVSACRDGGRSRLPRVLLSVPLCFGCTLGRLCDDCVFFC